MAVALFTTAMTLTPGPNNLMILASGANHGLYRSLPHYLGICLGFPAMVFAVGLGLGAAFSQWPILHSVLNIGGTLYLVYLAIRIAQMKGAHVKGEGRENGTRDMPLNFWQAALFQWLNPKAWLMAIGAISVFTTLEGNRLLQVSAIALFYMASAFPCVGAWLLLGRQVRALLGSSRRLAVFNRVMAALLVLSALPGLRLGAE